MVDVFIVGEIFRVFNGEVGKDEVEKKGVGEEELKVGLVMSNEYG